MKSFRFIFQTPDAILLDSQVESALFETELGLMEVNASYASITASVKATPVVVRVSEDSTLEYFGREGVFTFDNASNTGRLLLISAELKGETSQETMEEYLHWVQTQLAEGKDLSPLQLQWLEGEKVSVMKQKQG